MFFLVCRSPRNVRNMGWNADLCTGCPRATCERCRWCCITTHTYPDNPLPLAPRCWKFCPVSIITHNDTLNNAYLFHNVDPVSIRMKPFMCHNMFHRLHPMHPRFTLSRVWHQPGSTTQQPSTFKNPPPLVFQRPSKNPWRKALLVDGVCVCVSLPWHDQTWSSQPDIPR